MPLKQLLNFSPTQRMRIKKVIPSLISLMNACAGFLSILCAIHDALILSGIFICVAALLDACDGRVARRLKATSDLGIELDSLCDVVSFVIAPSIMVYALWAPTTPVMVTGSLLCFISAGLFRLARFNITHDLQKNHFIGLPTPLAATLLIGITSYLTWYGVSYAHWYASISTLMLAGLMASRVPIPTGK